MLVVGSVVFKKYGRFLVNRLIDLRGSFVNDYTICFLRFFIFVGVSIYVYVAIITISD